jgi:hypothetical protein
MAMPTEKVSLTLDAEALRQARELAGPRGLSAYVDAALKLKLQNTRIRKLLRELDAEHGPVPDHIKEEVDRKWREADERWLEQRRRSRSSHSS